MGSCLQSLLLSNLQITPTYCILKNFPSIIVHCNPGIRQVVLDFCVLIDEHWVHGRGEHHMHLFLDTFTTRNQPRLDDRVYVVRVPNIVDVLGEVVW